MLGKPNYSTKMELPQSEMCAHANTSPLVCLLHVGVPPLSYCSLSFKRLADSGAASPEVTGVALGHPF